MEKVIWNNSMLMEEACKRAEKQLQEMFPDKELTEELTPGIITYKEYYQDIFDGLYDDMIENLPKELSIDNNNWFSYEDDTDISYQTLSNTEFKFQYEGLNTQTINVNNLTIEEIEESLKFYNYSLWDNSEDFYPLRVALYRYIYLNNIHNDSRY